MTSRLPFSHALPAAPPPRPSSPSWRRVASTLVLAAVAGKLARLAALPLPWMLGPLFAVAGARMCGAHLKPLPGGRQAGQWAIGTALGLYFTPTVVAQLEHYAPLVLGAALSAMLLGMLCALFTLRWGGVDAPTAFFASLPGGATEMAVLAERSGGAVDRIAAAHAVRVMMVVSVVPFALTWSGAQGGDTYAPLAHTVDWARFPLLVGVGLAGVAVLRALRLANAWVLGPLAGVGVVTAFDVSLSALPGWLVTGGQLLIGCALGSRFSREFFRAAPRFMGVAALSAVFSLLLAFLFAIVLAEGSDVPLATFTLATAPGGVAEMCITAQVLRLGVPLVTAAHVLRVVVITLGAQPAYRLFKRWAGGARR